MTSDTCKNCHQPIVWAKSEKGFRVPLDPDPSPDGTLRLEGPFVRYSQFGDRTSHNKTCPKRRGRRRR